MRPNPRCACRGSPSAASRQSPSSSKAAKIVMKPPSRHRSSVTPRYGPCASDCAWRSAEPAIPAIPRSFAIGCTSTNATGRASTGRSTETPMKARTAPSPTSFTLRRDPRPPSSAATPSPRDDRTARRTALGRGRYVRAQHHATRRSAEPSTRGVPASAAERNGHQHTDDHRDDDGARLDDRRTDRDVDTDGPPATIWRAFATPMPASRPTAEATTPTAAASMSTARLT